MKDLDFDELDRAVNSLITSQSSVGSDLTSNSASQAQVTPSVSLSNINVVSKPAISPTATANPISSPVIGRPTTGRFMDMVRSVPDAKLPLSMPTRVAAPAHSQVETQIAPVTPVAASVPTAAVQPLAAPNLVAYDADEDDDINQISNEIDRTLGQINNEPQESPFISGAKVEKRPLNAFMAEQSSAAAVHSSSVVVPISPDINSIPASATLASVNTSATVNTFSAPVSDTSSYEASAKAEHDRLAQLDTPLPAELQSDLLSIESRETTQSDEYNIPTVSIAPVVETPGISVSNQAIQTNDSDQITSSSSISNTPVQNSVPTASISAQPANLNPVVSTSITQQYTEQPNSGEKDSGAIYDTKSYHKAMNGSSKKKSSMKIVIWAVVMIVISVGAGIAVYRFVLPNL